VTLGLAERQGDLLDDLKRFCDEALPENSIYAVLHRERDRLFPDELFADLFSDRGRRSVPPSVVAVVMVLQRLEGLSDREAVERYAYDVRWRYAAGVGGYDTGGWTSFAHTVLVDMRARLAASDDDRRIFNVTVEAAGAAGLVGAKRVLDSTPLYDAVATMDTITLIRAAIRGLLKAADHALETALRRLLCSGDDYATSAKPQIDWDDPTAREELIDSRARDAFACLAYLDGTELAPEVSQAAELLAKAAGQDLEEGVDGVFRIARKVAPDRLISTVDPEARHGHKTQARGFDGYKGHAAIDPDTEIITDTVVSAANAGDASVAPDLIDDLIGPDPSDADDTDTGESVDERAEPSGSPVGAAVYGDAAYGAGEFLERLEASGVEPHCKVRPASSAGGRFTKDEFIINLDEDEVTCPAGETVDIEWHPEGNGVAEFADHCARCPLRRACTTSARGRSIVITSHEEVLTRMRVAQRDPAWLADYRATRPKVERKLGHLMRRRHGGRRARVRGTKKVDADFNLLAAAQNLARLAMLSLHWTSTGWAAARP
jgi:hypothetical protein